VAAVVDPTLPRDGTDLMTLRVEMGSIDRIRKKGILLLHLLLPLFLESAKSV
jgi:hypothetical protein